MGTYCIVEAKISTIDETSVTQVGKKNNSNCKKKKLKVTVFWDVAPCSLVERYRSFWKSAVKIITILFSMKTAAITSSKLAYITSHNT
jgi:hypothetical protein